MTQVKMPEPVAEVCSGHTLHWAGSGPIAPLCERTGARVGSLLITTTQAEAYADARVREALELAAQTCENQGRATTTLDGESFYIALGQAARAIRAITPPLPGPVEP